MIEWVFLVHLNENERKELFIVKTSVTFRHMDATDALKNYAQERIQRVTKYSPDPISCHVVMSAEKYLHTVDITLRLHNGFSVAGHESTEDMYSSVDLVIAKIERQIRRYKEKLVNHKLQKNIPPISVSHAVIAEKGTEGAHVSEQDDSNSNKHFESADLNALKIVHREEYAAESMSIEQAIIQINLLHRQFLVFCNQTNNEMNVLYHRKDGTYGLIGVSKVNAAKE